jgi:hypothetical protein
METDLALISDVSGLVRELWCAARSNKNRRRKQILGTRGFDSKYESFMFMVGIFDLEALGVKCCNRKEPI